jgi:hypothetical protein
VVTLKPSEAGIFRVYSAEGIYNAKKKLDVSLGKAIQFGLICVHQCPPAVQVSPMRHWPQKLAEELTASSGCGRRYAATSTWWSSTRSGRPAAADLPDSHRAVGAYIKNGACGDVGARVNLRHAPSGGTFPLQCRQINLIFVAPGRGSMPRCGAQS